MSDTLMSFWWFVAIILPIIMVWSIVWKGLALWRAAKNNSLPWFVALLILNTMGILEILYLFVFGKKEKPNIEKKIDGELPKTM